MKLNKCPLTFKVEDTSREHKFLHWDRCENLVKILLVSLCYICMLAINKTYSANYLFQGTGETSRLFNKNISLTISNTNNINISYVDVNKRYAIYGGIDTFTIADNRKPIDKSGLYEGWAIPGCSGCVMYLTGSWSGSSQIECNGGAARRNRGFSFDNYGRMSAVGENAILEGRWSIAGPGTLCAADATMDMTGVTSYWIPTNSTFINTTLGVNVYVPLTAASGTYSIPQIVIRQGQYGRDSWAYITTGDTFTVSDRVTSCSISHPSSLILSPNIAQSSVINWSCTGPEPSSMRVEMTVMSGLPTSDGTGMALVPTGGMASVNGEGIIVRGTTKTGTAASCTASADNNTIYWNVSGKGGVLPVSYSNKKTLLSWIACGTSATKPGKYQGSATLKFIYK